MCDYDEFQDNSSAVASKQSGAKQDELPEAFADYFHEPVKTSFVYVKRGEGGDAGKCWYYVEKPKNGGEGTERFISLSRVQGILVGAKTTPFESKKYGTKWKLDLTLAREGKENITIRSGLYSEFSKSIICSLSNIEDFKQNITISVKPASEKRVVFGSVYVDELWVDPTRDKYSDMLPPPKAAVDSELDPAVDCLVQTIAKRIEPF